jgi:sulfur-oxidizing protein SoxZ
VPARARRGESVSVRALVQHPMESGFRLDERGQRIARDMIDRFVCTFNGLEVFRVDWQDGVAANPLIEFRFAVTASGRFEFNWRGDHGFVALASASIEVT